MKNICCFPFLFESKKSEAKPKEKEKKYEQNLQKTFTFFSKLHLDSSKPTDQRDRKIATAAENSK